MKPIADYVSLIANFEACESTRMLQDYYARPSFPEILSVGRQESAHTSFLAWLLDPRSDHGLGVGPLEAFVRIVADRFESQFREKFLLQGQYVFEDVRVSVENWISGRNRLDLLIEMKVKFLDGLQMPFCIVVENKVKSSEHDRQTQRYYESFSATHPGVAVSYVYLQPMSSLRLSDPIRLHSCERCACPHFVYVNYQDVMDRIIEPILEDIPGNCRVRFILEEYIHCLTIPMEDISELNSKTKFTIMAISDRERKLLTDFWTKNETLILSALKVLSEDPEQDQENRAEYEKALGVLNRKKDNSRYSINGAGRFGKCELPLRICQTYMKDGFSEKRMQTLKRVLNGWSSLKSNKVVFDRGEIGDFEKNAWRYHEFYGSYVSNQMHPAKIAHVIIAANNGLEGIRVKKI